MSTRKHRWLDHPKAVQDYHARYVAGVGVDAGGGRDQPQATRDTTGGGGPPGSATALQTHRRRCRIRSSGGGTPEGDNVCGPTDGAEHVLGGEPPEMLRQGCKNQRCRRRPSGGFPPGRPGRHNQTNPPAPGTRKRARGGSQPRNRATDPPVVGTRARGEPTGKTVGFGWRRPRKRVRTVVTKPVCDGG